MQMKTITLNFKLDPGQFNSLMSKLDGIREAIAANIDNPKKLAALTERLKVSSQALSDVIAQEQQQPKEKK